MLNHLNPLSPTCPINGTAEKFGRVPPEEPVPAPLALKINILPGITGSSGSTSGQPKRGNRALTTRNTAIRAAPIIRLSLSSRPLRQPLATGLPRSRPYSCKWSSRLAAGIPIQATPGRNGQQAPRRRLPATGNSTTSFSAPRLGQTTQRTLLGRLARLRSASFSTAQIAKYALSEGFQADPLPHGKQPMGPSQMMARSSGSASGLRSVGLPARNGFCLQGALPRLWLT